MRSIKTIITIHLSDIRDLENTLKELKKITDLQAEIRIEIGK